MAKKITVIIVLLLALAGVGALAVKMQRQNSTESKTSTSNTGSKDDVLSSSTNQTSSSTSGIPVDFNSPLASEAKYANGQEVISYQLYEKIKKLTVSNTGGVITFDTTNPNVPSFNITSGTKIHKTTLKAVTPAAISDLKEGLYVTVATYYIVKDRHWGPVSDVFINTEYQGPITK